MQQVLQTFWRQGYADTSVDALCEAAGLNKASLYAGFGDKAQLYRLALGAYLAQAGQAMSVALFEPGMALGPSLHRLLAHTADAYRAGRGCFMVSTAPMVAWQDEAVREAMDQALAAQSQLLARRFSQARAEAELACGVSDEVLAGLVAATLHSMSVRARSGMPEAALLRWAQAEIDGLLVLAGGSRPA